jgi:mRNA deadenylase subunit
MNTEYTNSSNNHNGFSGSSGFQYHRTFSTNPPELDTSNSNPIHIHGTIENPIIRDVWEDNFEEEFRSIMTLIEKYKVVGMVMNSFMKINLLGYRIPWNRL